MARFIRFFAPKNREFFDLFEEAGNNILRAAELLDELLRGYPERAVLAKDIVVCEQEGDRITHDIIQRLNHSSIPPFDKEDILALASALDKLMSDPGLRQELGARGYSRVLAEYTNSTVAQRVTTFWRTLVQATG